MDVKKTTDRTEGTMSDIIVCNGKFHKKLRTSANFSRRGMVTAFCVSGTVRCLGWNRR